MALLSSGGFVVFLHVDEDERYGSSPVRPFLWNQSGDAPRLSRRLLFLFWLLVLLSLILECATIFFSFFFLCATFFPPGD